MTDSTGGDRPSGGGSSEHAQVLSEVLEDQKRRQEVRETAVVLQGDSPLFVQVGLLVSSVFFFYLLFFSPAWIAPTAPPEITADRTEANLRWYLYTVSQSVETIRTQQGDLPGSVEEIPAAKPGTTYERLPGDTYRIGFTDGEMSLTFVSTEDPAEFLGDATELVLRGVT